MRTALIAALALVFCLSVPAGASAHPSSGSESPFVAVTCWLGSDPIKVPADRVVAQGGGLRIEYKGSAQLTTVPCIARVSLGTDPVITEPAKVHCLDHGGAPIYEGVTLQVGLSDGVLWWYEEGDGGADYVLVLSTAQCATDLGSGASDR